MNLIYAEARPQTDLPIAPFQTWTSPAGHSGVEFFRTPGGSYRVRFPGAADFDIRHADGQVTCVPVPEVARNVLDHIYANQVLPLVNSRLGRITLHASAVAVDQCCVAFLGPAGRGKSTLAARLALAGHSLVSDDGLEVQVSGGRWWTPPVRADVRLNTDSMTNVFSPLAAKDATRVTRKHIVNPDLLARCNARVPLGAVYVLDHNGVDLPTFEAIDPRHALIELVRHSFVLDFEDRAVVGAQFAQFSEFVAAVPCWRLDYPRQWDQLPAICEEVARHARSSTSGRTDAAPAVA